METKSYNEFYLSDVSENVGAMFEYAVSNGFSPKVFWQYFVNSIVAQQIENGNPKYITGYSGRDFIDIIISTETINGFSKKEKIINTKQPLTFDMYYWAGWAIAHLQYQTNLSFYLIDKYMPITRVLELYPTLHEADISKFIEVAKTYLIEEKQETNLKKIRTASGLSQNNLAKISGVDLRSIQMYEQKRNDINKAQVVTLLKLSKVLGCKIEDLLENN